MMHPRISVDGICFIGMPIAGQAECWRALQAQRVSILDPGMEADGVASVSAALGTGNYILETIVHPFLPGQALNPDPASWEVPRQRLMQQLDNAVQLGARSIYMVTGGHGGMLWEQAAEVFTAAVRPCAERAKAEGIALMIENAPPQYADIHIAHTLRDTIALAKIAGIGVCIDLAGCWTEPDLKGLLHEAVPLSDLVQVSDYVTGDRNLPARAVPGDGAVPLEYMLGELLAAGYEGAFDLELIGPRIDEEGRLEATRRAADNVGNILSALGA